MNRLKDWLADTTPAQRARLAKHAQTTVGTLRHLAGGYRSEGTLHLGTDFAVRIAKASEKIKPDAPLKREELSATCRRCEYARLCTGK